MEGANFVISLEKVKIFHDDPKFFYHHNVLTYPQKYSDGPPPPHPGVIHAGGVSFTSHEESLLKCLVESGERISLFCYRKEKMIFSSFDSLRENALDPFLYSKEKSIRNKEFGWVRGYNLTQNTESLIPATLVYVNYFKDVKEPFLTTPISTGAAGGFDHISTLLRGIYEVIERDTFMTVYLTGAIPPRLDLFKLKNNQIREIVNLCRRYKLELCVYDITNDLNIPSFLSLLIDKSGYGPAVSAGAKSHMNISEAIIGSIAESFLGRLLIRKIMHGQKSTHKLTNFLLMKTAEERGLFWSSMARFNDLRYLFSNRSKVLPNNSFLYKSDEQLKRVIRALKSKGFDIYYKDITLDIFRKLNLSVYKVIIPGLQPLYFNESNKELIMERLKCVSGFFGRKKLSINKIPHPFL